MNLAFRFLILFVVQLVIHFSVSVKSYGAEVLNPIVVQKKDRTRLDPHATFKSERVSEKSLKSPSRQNLTQVLKDQVGVDAQVYCSNCGAKRLTINGLRAENTSLLIDGLPLHSSVSGFYGVDSVGPNGIYEIEVMRGTGASLTNPEAIGGTINIITLDPLESPLSSLSTSFSSNDQAEVSAQNQQALFSYANQDKTFGVLFGAQYTEQKPWDENKNGIAESPMRDSLNVFTKIKFMAGKKNEFFLRTSINELKILGGPSKNAKKPETISDEEVLPSDFEILGDVESKYVGDNREITDWINLKRYEGQFKWMHHFADDFKIDLNLGVARQEQRSLYQHGFDYANNDILWVGDLKVEKLWNEHIFNAGLFFKDQRLRSTSEILFEDRGLRKDSFNHKSLAFYLRDTYVMSEKFEMDLALRFDQVNMTWIDLENEISNLVIAPRVQLKNSITDHLTQRLSYGLGYRTPLTYFESQHTNSEVGYEVDISKIESADSLVYTLSYNTPKHYSTFGSHYTHLKNMSFADEPNDLTQPVFFRNANEAYDIWAFDILVGYKLNPSLMLELSYEHFLFEDGYTKKLPTASIEQRLQFKSSYEKGRWSAFMNLSFVPSRDLGRYGDYINHYRVYRLSSTAEFIDPKNLKADSFFTLDAEGQYKVNKYFSLSFGVKNLLDQTQVSSKDSPSMWHNHLGHAHYDGLHTWGPNRGREWYLQLSANF